MKLSNDILNAKEYLVGKLNQKTNTVYPPIQNKTVTPSEQAQEITADTGYYALDKVTVNEIPSEYIIPSGSLDITSNGEYDVTEKETANVNVQFVAQSKIVTPTKQTQEILPDANIDALSKVTVNPIPNEYIVPSGTLNISENGNYNVTDKANANVNIQFVTQAKTVTPTKQVQEVTPDNGKDGLSKVTVNAIPNEYIVPSGTQSITQNGIFDVTDKASASVNVQPDLETKSITITTNGTTTVNKSSNKDGMTSVAITTNVQPNLQSKSVTIEENTTTNISADSGYDGLSSVSVTTNVPTGSTAKITDGAYFFTSSDTRINDYENLKTLFGTLTSVTRMFNQANPTNQMEINVDVDTHLITNFQYMFASTNTNITKIVADLDTSSATLMNYMFYQSKAVTIDVSSFDTSNVTRFDSMFGNCTNLVNVDISNFDFSGIGTNTSAPVLFYNGSCPNLSNDSVHSVIKALLTMPSTVLSGWKTLKKIGLTSDQATVGTTFTEWQTLSANGWTTGY